MSMMWWGSGLGAALVAEVERVRRIVTLAEAVFTVWLGALRGCPGAGALHRLCPWGGGGLRQLDWSTASSHNPLEVDIVIPRR